jgi:hypothetical protein
MRILIDADPIVYRCGFAAESATYDVVVEGGDGALQQLYFTAGARENGEPGSANDLLNEWLEKNPGWDVVSKTKEVIPEDVGHALHLVNLNILNIVTAVSREYKIPKTAIEIESFLTGPGNFREKVATIRPYKGNRDPSHKPYHYQAIRDHLHNNWETQVISGIEADDEVCIRATELYAKDEDFCVATIDKDLDQVLGRHYDYLKKVFYFVDPDHAQWWFWVQVLCGDTTDNIPGCYRVGTAKAEASINAYLQDKTGYIDIWPFIVSKYQESIDKYGAEKTGYSDPEAAALETARLVRMLTVRDEPLWTPPTQS